VFGSRTSGIGFVFRFGGFRYINDMTSPHPKRRWFVPTPGRLLVVLLVAEGILLSANWFHWFPKGWAVLMTVAAVGVFLVVTLIWFVVALAFHRRFQFSL
jgi:hypothetical protein